MKKLIATSLLIATLTVLLCVTALASGQVGYVTADVLNVRSQGIVNENSIILGKLTYGDSVKIIGTDGNWFKIDYLGMAAFVHGDYITTRNISTASSRSNADRTKGQAVIDLAKTFIGTPYVWGGSSPSGFDCSGFTYYIYKQFGVTLNRVSYEQAYNGTPVSKDELMPGDIVLFSSNGERINHVGLYVGDGNFIHSPQTGKNVEITSLSSGYFSRGYVGARRIFN